MHTLIIKPKLLHTSYSAKRKSFRIMKQMLQYQLLTKSHKQVDQKIKA